MILRNNIRSKSISSTKNKTFREDVLGFWGNVIGVNAKELSVDVQACTGMKYRGIPCVSKEWVIYDKSKDYVPAERDLPPIGSRVFVLMPTHSLSGAFVLCSGFARGEPSVRGLFANNDSDKEKYRTIKEHISQGGWNEKEFSENGNRVIHNLDNSITITLGNTSDSENNIEEEVSIKAWNQTVKITKDGISVDTDKPIKLDGSEIDMNGDSRTFVTFAELKTALDSYVTKLTTSLNTTLIVGNGSTQVWTNLPTSIDLSAAEAKKIKTGGNE